MVEGSHAGRSALKSLALCILFRCGLYVNYHLLQEEDSLVRVELCTDLHVIRSHSTGLSFSRIIVFL